MAAALPTKCALRRHGQTTRELSTHLARTLFPKGTERMFPQLNNTTMTFVDLKREDLLALPVREWHLSSVYDTILVCPTPEVHPSGYRIMAIIGCRKGKPIEIAAFCDNIDIKDTCTIFAPCGHIQCDMILSNCIHFHSFYGVFEVGKSLSSTRVTLINDVKQ